MLVDDNEVDNFINQKMIEGSNFADHVYIHTSSRSALEFLHNLERSSDVPESMIPGVIFLDINMPIMDGLQFLDEFEKLTDEFRKNTEVIMLTSSVNPKDLEKAQFNDRVKTYLNKPLSSIHLGCI
ncbi:MAG: response regulator [Flavobacteriales bacterium]|nr:response regulator [Flavobacteriales bacterium]